MTPEKQCGQEFWEWVRFCVGSAVGIWVIGTICAIAHGWASGGLP